MKPNSRQAQKIKRRILFRNFPAFIINGDQIDPYEFANLKPGQIMCGYDVPTVTRVRLR